MAALVIRLALFIGYQGFDDRTYIAYARLFALGGDIATSGLRDQWIGRIGAWLPIGLFMKVFGSAQWVLCLYSMLCSLGGIVLAFLLGRKLFSERHGLVAAALLALLPLDVFYATRAHADAAVGFWCALALTIWLLTERQSAMLPYLLVGVAVGIAYLTKETSIVVAVPLLLLVCYQRRLELRRLSLLAAGFAVVVVGELLFWSIVTGDPLYRWHAALAARNYTDLPTTITSLGGWIPGPKPTEIYRSTNSIFDAILMFAMNEEFGLLYYIVWPLAIWVLWRGKREAVPLVLFMIPTALLLLFVPFHIPLFTLPRDPRYFTMLSVPAMTLLAWWSMQLKAPTRWAVLGGLAVTWLPCFYIGYTSSGVGLQRELVRFARSHATDRLWLHNRYAADVIVLSNFDPSLKLGIARLRLPVQEGSRLRTSPIRAMRPDLPVARTVDEIHDGFVAVPEPLRSQPPIGWRQAETLTDPPSALIIFVQRVLLSYRVSPQLVNNLAPSDGASVVIYQVGGASTAGTQ